MNVRKNGNLCSRRDRHLRLELVYIVAFLSLVTVRSELASAQVGNAPAPPPRVQAPQAAQKVQARRARQVQPGRRAQVISDQQFDQWVFREDHSAEAARRRQESVLALKVEEVDRACRLTPEQKQKLQLIGQGDIKRFFDRYETLKEKSYAAMQGNQNLNAIFQETNPLANTLQLGLFGGGSLFQRSFAITLTKAQMTSYEAVLRERIQFRQNANIDLLVSTLEEAVPLPSVQRQKLIAFLRQEIKTPPITGNYDFYYLMWQLGQIPEEKLKSFFDAAQWRTVDRFATQYKGMEPTLRQSGYFRKPDGDVEGPDAEAIVPNS